MFSMEDCSSSSTRLADLERSQSHSILFQSALDRERALKTREDAFSSLEISLASAAPEAAGLDEFVPREECVVDEYEDVLELECAVPVAVEERRPAKASDFEVVREIGQGAFGRVLLVKRKKNGHMLAMKVLQKSAVVKRQNQRYIMGERDILTQMDHPFIVRLKCALQTQSRLFLVMEYLPGGELLKHIREEGLLNEDQTAFYVGECVLALEYLHSRNIVHRDLKPENVLLDMDGHIRLTDFGLARSVNEVGLKSVCGTDLYLAPEMISGKGTYGTSVDWWALGCLTFEMLTGDPPFYAKERKALYKMILNQNPKYSPFMSDTCVKLLKGMLDRNVERRLGSTKSTMFEARGVHELKSHAFFKKINWKDLEHKMLAPPIKPHNLGMAGLEVPKKPIQNGNNKGGCGGGGGFGGNKDGKKKKPPTPPPHPSTTDEPPTDDNLDLASEDGGNGSEPRDFVGFSFVSPAFMSPAAKTPAMSLAMRAMIE